MSNPAVTTAIKSIVEEDGMAPAYESRLTTLINNAMMANVDESDIESLLELIEVGETHDEN